MTRRHWWTDAACIGHLDLFELPDRITPQQWRRHRHHRNNADKAKAICQGCPVLTECRAETIEQPYPSHIAGGWLPWEVPLR